MMVLKMLLYILLVGLGTFFFKLFRIADVMLYASAILIPFFIVDTCMIKSIKINKKGTMSNLASCFILLE